MLTWSRRWLASARRDFKEDARAVILTTCQQREFVVVVEVIVKGEVTGDDVLTDATIEMKWAGHTLQEQWRKLDMKR